MKIPLVFTLAALLLTGCQTTVWYKEGASVEEFNKDMAQANYNANIATAGIVAPSQGGAGAAIATGVTTGMKRVELAKEYMFMRGWRLVPKDTEAGKGNEETQHKLSFEQTLGADVPERSTSAVEAYRASAEQGDAKAQFALGWIYASGKGVPKNLVQSHAWLNIAGAKGNEEAKKNLAIVEKEMTTEQKDEAMKLAREMFAKLPTGK